MNSLAGAEESGWGWGRDRLMVIKGQMWDRCGGPQHSKQQGSRRCSGRAGVRSRVCSGAGWGRMLTLRGPRAPSGKCPSLAGGQNSEPETQVWRS